MDLGSCKSSLPSMIIKIPILSVPGDFLVQMLKWVFLGSSDTENEKEFEGIDKKNFSD